MREVFLDVYPRVLVINGEPFSQDCATGLTMSRLFKGWPAEQLACLYISDRNSDWSICKHYWKLTLNDLQFIHRLIGNSQSKEVADSHVDERIAAPSPKNPHTESTVVQFGKRLRKRLAGQSVRELDIYQVPDRVLYEIDQFAPQVIYSMLASNALMNLILEISDRLDIPVIPHFMDDWPTTLFHSSILKPILRRMMFRRLKTILTRSPKRLVIGDAMAEEYARRYGGEFLPFMNTVEPELFKAQAPLPRRILRLVYVGGLHLNRWRSLREIGLALNMLQAEGVQAEALIYSPSRFAAEGKKLNLPPAMRFAGSLAPSQVPGALREADILLHVESFDRISRTYARYSVSTKIPEYMAAARPILAYGPQELASIRYVRDSGAGLAVGRRERSELLDALRSLLASKSMRETLGSKGYQVALSRHNAALQRDQFRVVLKFFAG